MNEIPFYIVDVFAERKYEGNQLAVVLNADALKDEEMQKIACEMNYSETTFVGRGSREKGYDVRIFTPRTEIPFAGHPVLGTAYVIVQEILKEKASRVFLNLKAGRVDVEINYRNGKADVLWMSQPEPVFGEKIEIKTISEVLGIDESHVDSNFPVQEVSTGLPFIIVPLRSLEALRKISLSSERYYSLVENLEAKAILAFSPETYSPDRDLSVRVFAPYYGVSEDPATGSANGCLAAYLSKYRYLGSDHVEVRAEQGYEVERPSLLYLRAEEKEGRISVRVGGRVVMTARGFLLRSD